MTNKHRDALKRANAALMQGNLDLADAICRESVSGLSGDPNFWGLYGAINARKGKLNKAEQCYRTVTELRPDVAEGWYYYSMSLVYQGRQSDAVIEMLNRAIQCKPGYLEAMMARACLLRDAGYTDQALECFSEIIEINPGLPDVYMQIGNLHRRMADYAQSEQYLDKALSLSPEDPVALASLASVKYRQRDLQKADELIERSLRTRVRHPIVAQALVEITRRKGANKEALRYVESVIDQGGIAQIEQEELHFAAADLCDKQKEYGRAFEHAVQANAGRAGIFDLERYSRYLESIMARHTRENLSPKTGQSPVGVTPVFIVGMPRSGSSLVEQMLSCHPGLHGGGELTFLEEVYLNETGMRFYEPDAPAAMLNMTGSQAQSIAASYLSYLSELSEGEKLVTDKLPLNFERIGLINMLFPDAIILHTRRNPLDTCLSCYFSNFGNNNTYVYDLEKLGHVYKLYEQLMEFWERNSLIDIHTVEYEKLVTQPDDEIAAMLEHCGLGWDRRCLEFHESERVVATASYDQVTMPLYSNSVGRWQNYAGQLETLRGILEQP